MVRRVPHRSQPRAELTGIDDPDLGPDLHYFFNDTYFPLLGPRLEWAMGERSEVVWADAWEQAKPIIEGCLRQAHPELPVVLTTGYSDVLASDDAHGFELFPKPYSAEQVAGPLREAVMRTDRIVTT